MPRNMPIQDAWQVHLLHEGQEHHKSINAFRGNLHFFFHAPQYASYFHFCLSCYANVKYQALQNGLSEGIIVLLLGDASRYGRGSQTWHEINSNHFVEQMPYETYI